MGWPSRLGLAILTTLGGAVAGLGLSLTQGSHVRHWPWLAVGGLATLAVDLVVIEFLVRRTHRASEETAPENPVPSAGVIIRAHQLRNKGAILASGAGAFINVVSNDFANSGIMHVDQGPSTASSRPTEAE